MDQKLIEQYAEGAAKLGRSIEGLSREELTAFPVPGTWSIQQIVLHVMDSDLVAADRMKRVAAEEKPPTLIGFDESAYAKNLFPHELDPRLACEIFEKNRLLTAEILRRLPSESFQRKGHHNEYGDVTLAGLLNYFANHLEHHLKFIYEKRKLLGKPL